MPDFFTSALPYATLALSRTNVLTSVILAQWADETGYNWPPRYNNPGNVGDPSYGGQTGYPTIEIGVEAYIQTLLLPYYIHVRTGTTDLQQCVALGQSPWAASHYNDGSGPGTVLVAIINENNLTRFDQPPEEFMFALIANGLLHVFGELNGIAYHWFQPNPFPPGHTPIWNVEQLPT
jgi:hypothetical protein